MKRQMICLMAGAVLAAGIGWPTASFAAPKNLEPLDPRGNGGDSTQYEYYDENGSVIYDDDETLGDAPREFYPDTSWFDYTDPKKEYKISTQEELFGLASLVNEQQAMWKTNRFETFEGVTFKLDNDIDLTQKWVPIGSDDHITFKGVFDGQGHAINSLDVDITGNNGGFFGYLSGTVKNLTIRGKVKATGKECGSLAGYLTPEAKIMRCVNEATVDANAQTGGIAGENNGGSIYQCTNKGKVTGSIKVGGIVGENRGKVSCSCNMADVKSSQRGTTTYGTGGVAGRSVTSNAKIDRCYNKGAITSKTEGTGGIVGYTNTEGSRITSCYNTGSISVKNPKAIEGIGAAKGFAGGIAGIVGVKGVTIRNCYCTGDVLNSDVTGGIIGKYDNVSKRREDPFIVNNYFTNQNTKYGIGYDSVGKSRNITKGTTITSTASLISGASNLGPYYMNDTSGSYGNSSLPVLSWQKPVPEDEMVYLSGVPVEVQQELNEFVTAYNKEAKAGDSVMMFFNHYEFTSTAVGEYNNAK